MNKKGFTLVEILAVIVLVSLITVIAIGASNGVGDKNKEKILKSKQEFAKNEIRNWSIDNEACFTNTSAFNCLVKLGSGCTASGNLVNCQVTYGQLAEKELIGFDKEESGTKIVINPVDGTSMNNTGISFSYDKNKRTIKFE